MIPSPANWSAKMSSHEGCDVESARTGRDSGAQQCSGIPASHHSGCRGYGSERTSFPWLADKLDLLGGELRIPINSSAPRSPSATSPSTSSPRTPTPARSSPSRTRPPAPNHPRLGQLMTYTAGTGASAVERTNTGPPSTGSTRGPRSRGCRTRLRGREAASHPSGFCPRERYRRPPRLRGREATSHPSRPPAPVSAAEDRPRCTATGSAVKYYPYKH